MVCQVDDVALTGSRCTGSEVLFVSQEAVTRNFVNADELAKKIDSCYR